VPRTLASRAYNAFVLSCFIVTVAAESVNDANRLARIYYLVVLAGHHLNVVLVGYIGVA